jgi:hypothetical protein
MVPNGIGWNRNKEGWNRENREDRVRGKKSEKNYPSS